MEPGDQLEGAATGAGGLEVRARTSTALHDPERELLFKVRTLTKHSSCLTLTPALLTVEGYGYI